MLTESMLIVPKVDNAGHNLDSLRDAIATALAESFGGVTMTEASGAWKNDAGQLVREPVTQLVSACEATPQSDKTLRELAARINRDGDQFATYCRFPDGHVEIIENAAKVDHAAPQPRNDHGVHNLGIAFRDLLGAARDYHRNGWNRHDASRLAAESIAPYREFQQAA